MNYFHFRSFLFHPRYSLIPTLKSLLFLLLLSDPFNLIHYMVLFHLLHSQVTRASSNQNIEDGSSELFLQNDFVLDFMRFKRGINGGIGELQTAIVSYKTKVSWPLSRSPLQVDLVSTIHIADKEYFLTLQKELESYDCVLYEMVTSRENLEYKTHSGVAKQLKASRTKNISIIRFIQRLSARLLMLAYQADYLNYQADNWYHADLDYETFKFLQAEKGESFFTLARDMTLRSTKTVWQLALVSEDLDSWRSMLLWASRILLIPLVGLRIIMSVFTNKGSQASEFPAIGALSRLDFVAALKVVLARSLTSDFFRLAAAEVEEESVLIGDRNRAAIESLRNAIEDGHNRIAILYGGGHMPDLGRRLMEDFDLIPCGVQWITAWSIKKRNLNRLKTMISWLPWWPLNCYQMLTLTLLIFSSILALDFWFWELCFGTSVN